MNKRTPGPWRVEEVGDSGGDNPVPVCEVTADGYRRVAEHLSEADARFIAAAPELFAALIAARGCVENASVRRVVDAAISKAIGDDK